MRRTRAKNILSAMVAACLFGLAAFCIWTRADVISPGGEKAALAAAALAMPAAGMDPVRANAPTRSTEVPTASVTSPSQGTLPPVADSTDTHSDEPHFPVVETQYSEGQIQFGNFFLKNSADYPIDIGDYIDNSLGFAMEKSNKVQVLIVHTHTTESYIDYDAGYYHESFYPRSTDSSKNVVRVGDAIEKTLTSAGIGTVHAKEVHDDPKYTGAYSRSLSTITEYLEKYPDIKVVLDIHRDSISYTGGEGKVKPTFTVNGRKAAQIMILAGCDSDSSLDFPFWEENLTFALKLQQQAEDMYPGMTRPLYFGNFAYNMNVNPGSLLIEVGTDVNTLSEAVYTGELLGNVLVKVLQSD